MSSGGKLRKMVSRYKEAQMVEDMIREEMEHSKEKEKSEEYEDISVHGYYIYECRECGAVYKMWLEKGLEDTVQDRKYPEKHKPVPFGSDVNVVALTVFIFYGDLKLLRSMISSKRERVTLRMILKRSVEFLYCKRRILIDTPLYVSM